MKIQTVIGLADTNDIELVDGHGHVWIDPPQGVTGRVRLELNDSGMITAELKSFRAAGGSAIVDCQPGGCGRDGNMLKKLSEETELYITATTGFHLERYYPREAWLWSASETAAANYFIAELTNGLHEAGDVLATTIKVAHDGGPIKGQTQVLMEAAAEAARQTGALLLFHTEQGRRAEELLPFFDKRGVSPGRLYLCHLDKRPDFGLHRELAQAGALLGYDTFVRSQYKPAQNVWPLLKEMIEARLGDHIALGLDLAYAGLWRHYRPATKTTPPNGRQQRQVSSSSPHPEPERPGLMALPDQIVPRLQQEEIDDTVVAKLAGQNILRYLARR